MDLAYFAWNHKRTRSVIHVSSHVADFNTRTKILTAKTLKQGYRYQNIRKALSEFYRGHYDLVSKFNVELKSLPKQDLSGLEFYSDLAYKSEKMLGGKTFLISLEK